ncbi:hypothetical protein [Yersinia pseudotuberculosis]|uniref:hypothetical protein n=1 Tax=Yersinia pseudotuberculosis TaxID=633 RepID=UPI000F6FED00|nr:hypothetical protein [Yersinia pseudotuberculosis]VEE71074.1 autotransporter protein [Yersinia pseudotuberculosis]
MKNSNTLNTRLLPLSILISSLVSGGAMAVSQIATTDIPAAVTPIKSTPTGSFERNSAGTSFGSNVDVDVIDNTSTPTRVIAETTPEAESPIGEATGQESGNATAVTPPTTTPEQEITEPEQPGLLDKIKDLLGLGEITEEQAKALTKSVTDKAEKVKAQADAQKVLDDAKKEAEEAASQEKTKKIVNDSYQQFAKDKETAKQEAADEKLKQDKTKEDAIKAVKVNNTPLVPGDKDIAEKVTKAVTDTTKVQGEKAVTLATKITDAKVAQEKKDANTEALAEIDGRLISVSNALIQATGTDKGPLDQKLKEAQQAKTEQDGKELASGGYKELFEEDKKTSGYFGIAENDNGSGQQEKLAEAKKNRDAYNKAAKKELDAIAKAQKAVEAIDAQIVKLKKDKGDIEQEQSTEKGKTGGLDIALSGANDAKDAAQGEFDTAKNAAELAETAAKAIEAAKITDKAVEDATAAHTEAADKAEQTKTALEAAEKAKEDADKLVVTNTGLLNDADQALEQLVTAQNNAQPTLDLPAIDVTIAPAKTQDVIEGTSAIATQVAGGTQNVAKGGKAIDSVVTEGGTVELKEGYARGTELTKGTLNNNSGVDVDTVVGAEGKLVLTGSETAIATSTGAKVAAGGVVTAGDHSVIEKMISSGDVTASGNNTIVRDTTINDGKLSLAGTATANNTTFNGGIFSVEGDTTATKTTMTGGKFAVTGNAKIDESQ